MRRDVRSFGGAIGSLCGSARSLVGCVAICALMTLAPISVAKVFADGPSAPKAIIFYQVGDAKYFGGDETETDDHLAQAMLHDRMLPLLHELLNTEVVNLDLGVPKSEQLADACRAHEAVGVVAVRNVWQVRPDGRSAAIVQMTFENCNGTEWFTVDGTAYRETAHGANLSSMMDESIKAVSANLTKVVHDTPNAASNFVHYGFYMNDAEADSFWTLVIEKGKTIVDYCDPIGTAYRAGLRVGDDVSAVNGAPTDGVDQERLNAILENAKRDRTWALTVRGTGGATRELTFRNEPVSWYVAHPSR